MRWCIITIELTSGSLSCFDDLATVAFLFRSLFTQSRICFFFDIVYLLKNIYFIITPPPLVRYILCNKAMSGLSTCVPVSLKCYSIQCRYIYEVLFVIFPKKNSCFHTAFNKRILTRSYQFQAISYAYPRTCILLAYKRKKIIFF